MTPVSVVVPVKGNLHLTLGLLKSLKGQHYETLTVIDNGSPPQEQVRLRAAVEAMGGTVPIQPDLGIHAMWNMGLRGSVGHTAILNNDILLSPNALRGLAQALDDDPTIAVVSPRQRHQPESDRVVEATQIAIEYGIAGFAFMVAADFDHRFPEELHWFYGDNDMIRSAGKAGRRCAVVESAWVEHVGGGSQTGDWRDPMMLALIAADRATFNRKWMAEGYPYT